jgi:hypothetical protein
VAPPKVVPVGADEVKVMAWLITVNPTEMLVAEAARCAGAASPISRVAPHKHCQVQQGKTPSGLAAAVRRSPPTAPA